MPTRRVLFSGLWVLGVTSLVLVLFLALGSRPAPASAASDSSCTGQRFTDVCPNDWFYSHVQALTTLGAITGYPDSTFRPGLDITRGQLMKMIVVASGLPGQLPSVNTFADVPLTSPFFAWVEIGAANGVVSGYACGGVGEPCDGLHRPYFRPGLDVNRGQVAKIVTLSYGWAPYTPSSAVFKDVPSSSPYYGYVNRVALNSVISGYACGGPGEPCDGQSRPYFRAGNSSTRGQASKMVNLGRTAGTPQPTATNPPPGSTATRTPTRTPTRTATAPAPPPGTATPPPGIPCAIFPSDNVWNRNIAALPTAVRSAQYMASIGTGSVLHPSFGSGTWNGEPIGIPYVVVPGNQPRVAMSFTWPQQSDPGPYPVPTNAPIQGGPNSSGDRHVIVFESGTCTAYEMYDAHPHSDGSWDAGAGAKWPLTSNALRPDGWTSADAAGLPIVGGQVRYDEVASGVIRHAIRFSTDEIQRTWIWPARHSDGSSTDQNVPPMGLRLRLKASVNISGFDATNRVILQALKDYGMILSDTGDPLNIGGVPDSRWNDNVLHSLEQLHGSDFEAVDESGIMVDPNSGQTR